MEGVDKHDDVPYKYGSVDNTSGVVRGVRSGCNGCCSCGRRVVRGGCSSSEYVERDPQE